MSTHDIYSTEIPQPSSSPTGSPSGAGSGRFTPPPYQPVYFQPEPQVGCGTYVFRFVMIFLVVGFIGMAGLFMLFMIGAVSASIQQVSETNLTEKFISGNQNAKRKVAVITVEGVITGSEDGFIP
ncbi:MAG: hypothetical protein LBI18_11735, partial [Planctomycetaceae bacterium]|nr:hypothetical protein [Planctomycetaceae bacterium]